MSIADLIATGINFAALVFLGAQVMLARQALRDASKGQQEEWARQRRKAAIDATISTERYRESLKAGLPWNDSDPELVAEFLKQANGDRVKLAPVREYLNSLVDVAVGVKQGVLDLETIAMLDGRRIVETAISYAPYIEYIRQEINSDTVYRDIGDLAEMIEGVRPDLKSRRYALNTGGAEKDTSNADGSGDINVGTSPNPR